MPTSATRAILVTIAAASAVLALAACQPGPISSAFPGAPRPSATTVSPAPSAEPSVEPAPVPSPTRTGTPIPASCEDLSSAGMRDTLGSTLGPLNAAGFELVPTQNADGLDILASADSAIRCTWGVPGGDGLSTAVAAVTAAQSAALVDSLTSAGYACIPGGDGIRCDFEQRTVTLDDKLVTRGESHFVGADRWVATAWVGSIPSGYTDDLVTRLWG